MRSKTRTGALAAVAMAITLALSACGGGGGGSTDATAGDGEVVNLTYWGGAGSEKAVEVWNASHPDVQVKAVNVLNGQEATTKLLTAIAAGSGAPDVMATEYSNIPTLVAKDALSDIAPEGASDLAGSFPDSAWNSVTLGGDAVYGLPGDIGPMLFYYRTDVFDSLGLQPPKTWQEYAAAAKAVHDSDPSVYLGTFTGADASVFAALTQQAGASWYSIDGDAWGVGIDTPQTQKVADYWGGLLESGVIDNQPLFTPEWNAALNSGKQVGWLAPVWGAGVLGSNAADTKGKWAATSLPVWNAGDATSGNWGGQAQVVTSQTKHSAEAYEFVKWMTTSKEGLGALIDAIGIYPAATDKQGLTATPPAFLSDQSDFYDLVAKSADEVPPVTFGPNVNVAYTAYVDDAGKAVADRSRAELLAALTSIQDTTTADLKSSGFTVK